MTSRCSKIFQIYFVSILIQGTMSGGGKTISRGRMGQSVRVSNVNPKELENMEQYINEMEQHVRELRQKENLLENRINTLQPELRQMKFNYEKFSIELQVSKVPIIN